jgi:hypothetical protein
MMAKKHGEGFGNTSNPTEVHYVLDWSDSDNLRFTESGECLQWKSVALWEK